MRLLKRNTTEFEYLSLCDDETDLNDDGEHTGYFKPTYEKPVPYVGNISSPNGQSHHVFFGIASQYTHTLIMDDPKVDIKEGGLVRHNGNVYEVKAVRPSINVMNIALKEMLNPPEIQYAPVEEEDTQPEEPSQEEAGDGE